MKIQIWSIGKSHEDYVKKGVDDFTKRISNYYKAEWNIIPPPKNAGLLKEADLKKKEADMVLRMLQPADYLIALDENGSQLDSPGLARFLEERGNESRKTLVFLIGGAYGLDRSVIQRAGFSWSLSKLTFPHQLVRLVLTEQIYRACTIIRNEKYHHN